MKEISMHILDIVMNSVKANANLIELHIKDSKKKNILTVAIKDNGIGMSREIIKLVSDPFFTTRTTRKVGLGIPMLKVNCERCNGYFKIHSKIKEGTLIECSFERNNIDKPPLGDIGDTILSIINIMENCELIYKYETDTEVFLLNTADIKQMLDGVNIKENEILVWIKDYVNENIRSISNI